MDTRYTSPAEYPASDWRRATNTGKKEDKSR
jgi:hypothetical protein